MAEFFAMSGYAAYVWPAFGVTILVLRRMRAKEAELEALRQEMRTRRPARPAPVIRPHREPAQKP
jgi:heme exporter protein D